MYNANEGKNKVKGITFGRIVDILLILLIVFLIVGKIFFFESVRVSGASMDSTLYDGEYLILSKSQEVEKSDIIAFKSPLDPSEYYIKRVIATAGDTVEYKDDQLYINGEPVDEPYLDETKKIETNTVPLTEDFTLDTLGTVGHTTVPEGELFVMGDNRQRSSDSRVFGTIKTTSILGQLRLVLTKPFLDVSEL